MRDDAELEAGCLARLFTEHTPEVFLAQTWPSRPLVCHGPLTRLGALPELAALEPLLAAWGDQVRIALPDKRDEHSSRFVDVTTAATLHRDGMALIFNRVERFFPVVDAWLGRLRLELGLPLKCEPRAIIYATPAGAGNSPHFDANANFVVQLKGTKRWRIAPNEHVANPTDRWAMNQEAPAEELEGYLQGPLPTELPDDAHVIDLAPGSVLFVPRGYWHATEAEEDTLALNFTFGQPTWADVVLTALRGQLLRDEGWRALADGLCALEPERAAAAQALLQARLALLVREVEQLDAPALIEGLEARPRYLLLPEGFLRVEEGAVFASVGEEEFPLEVEAPLHPVLEWIAAQGSPFSLDEVASQFPSLAGALPGLLRHLQQQGLISP